MTASPQIIIPATASPLNLRLSASSTQPFTIFHPALGSSCQPTYLQLTPSSTSHSCTMALTASTCPSLNQYLISASTNPVCVDAACSGTVTPSFSAAVVPAVWDAGTGQCTGIINDVTVDVLVGYPTRAYRVQGVNVTLGTPVSQTGKVAIKYTINVKNSVQGLSGNPGYIIGKELKYSTGGIYQFYDSSTKACLLNSTIDTTKPLSLPFGLNTSYFCIPTSPCANTLYID